MGAHSANRRAAGAKSRLTSTARCAAAAFAVPRLAAACAFGESTGTVGAVTGPAAGCSSRSLVGCILLIRHCFILCFVKRFMRFQRGRRASTQNLTALSRKYQADRALPPQF